MNPELVIQRLAEVGRPILLRYMEPNSCIGSSRVVTYILDRFRIRSKPVPVNLAVKCPAKSFCFLVGFLEQRAAIRAKASEFIERKAKTTPFEASSGGRRRRLAH